MSAVDCVVLTFFYASGEKVPADGVTDVEHAGAVGKVEFQACLVVFAGSGVEPVGYVAYDI